jgi:formate-dependent nitrite reductase cytochrome c552 subunit
VSDLWTYDQSRGVYVCGMPGCRFTTPNLGAMQGHVRRKDHSAWARGQAASTPAGGGNGGSAPARRGPQSCPDCHGTEFRLLRKSVPAELQAIEAGYRAVCLKCQELV